MRNTMLAFASLLFVAGCGGNNNNMISLDAGHDLSQPNSGADLSVPPPTKTGCNGYIACLNNCDPSDSACATQCKNNTTSKGQQVYGNALFCGQSYCLGLNDAGPGECALSADMTMLVDPTGAPAGTCDNCLNNALAQLFGFPCMPANSPDCNPAQCASAYSACAQSTP